MIMKKLILSALACLLALPIMAQLGEERQNLAVGVNLGMNMTKVDFNPRIKQKSLNGMALCHFHTLFVQTVTASRQAIAQ